MKRMNWVLIGLATLCLILAMGPLAGCVFKSSYEALQAENAALVEENESLQDELYAKDAELNAINETLEEAKARMEIIVGIFVPAFTGELDEMTEAEAIAWFLEWRDQIMAIGDSVLTAKFEFFMDTFSDAALVSFFVYLFESTAEALE